jgi:filamentous hemagglutinin
MKTDKRTLSQLEQGKIARDARRFKGLAGKAGDVHQTLWMRVTATVMTVVMYFAPAVFLADQTARAAPPIVDSRAPVPFQPAITQTSTGVPAVNIAAPNAAGISANQYSSFNVDSAGLVLNNSLVSGTPLLGGTLGANPNLNGHPATTILNQVTSTAPSTLAGPVEVFGSPAVLIISNPNGLSVSGLSITNTPGLVLTTGVPQFITGAGGSSRCSLARRRRRRSLPRIWWRKASRTGRTRSWGQEAVCRPLGVRMRCW